jgi:hypothetical protein
MLNVPSKNIDEFKGGGVYSIFMQRSESLAAAAVTFANRFCG